MAEPENMVIRLLQDLRERMDRVDSKIDNLGADLRAEIKTLRADIASDLLAVDRRMGEQEKRTTEQIVGLRRAVVEYHSAVVGHGVHISDLDARVKALELARSGSR